MKDTASANCRELLEVLIAQGVECLVASPGSRNAPLLIGASARTNLKTRIVNDERAAGFIALGIAMASQKPVALCCTSGTALYNYAPAVAEAYYQKIPLIVISADRPEQWIDQDDSQTLHQHGALSKIVKKSFDIPAEPGMTTPCRNKTYSSEREWYVNRIANEAVLTALEDRMGPVHINIHLGEPLNETIDYKPSSPRIVKIIKNTSGLSTLILTQLSKYMASRKVMVVAGFMLPDASLNRALTYFAKLHNVTVLAETLSNLHFDAKAHFIDGLLVNIPEEKKDKFRPDIIITFGGALVSRKIKEFLRECTEAEHWTLGDTPMSVDCMQNLTTHIDISPMLFFRGIANVTRGLCRKGLEINSDYKETWQGLRDIVCELTADRIDECQWSEYQALGLLFRKMPRDVNLFLSNGTCVRYAELLIGRLPHCCFSCRGVSGIDGTNAAAAGIAAAYHGTTLLVTGDMSFSYYPEVLNPKNCPGDLRIVIINNKGGGIFRFIGTTKDLEQRETYFCSDPELPVEGLARAYGRPYKKVSDRSGMNSALEFLWNTPNAILEITVDPEESAQTLNEMMKRDSSFIPWYYKNIHNV